MPIDMDKMFLKYTEEKETRFGWEIKCTKGFWSGIAPTRNEALKEAKHYFIQYFNDGEYDEQ